MRNILQSIIQLFKKKVSEDDEIVNIYIKRMSRITDISPYDIIHKDESGLSYSLNKYQIKFGDTPIRINKVECHESYNGFNEETQTIYMKQGGIRKDKYIFYIIHVNTMEGEEVLKCSLDKIEKLYNLVHSVYKNQLELERTNKIKFNINPAADILDDSIYCNLPMDKR